MEANTLSAEERTLVVQIFKNIRQNLSNFMTERDFKMSNPQLFTFLMYAPVCLAIASDGVVDEKEIRLLSKITKDIDVNSAVNLDLMEVLALSPEPIEIMLNEEFNMRADAELLFLSRNMAKYEDDIINATKELLKLDKNPESGTSLKSTFSKWFDFVIERNAGRNKEQELEKVGKYKDKIGL